MSNYVKNDYLLVFLHLLHFSEQAQFPFLMLFLTLNAIYSPAAIPNNAIKPISSPPNYWSRRPRPYNISSFLSHQYAPHLIHYRSHYPA